MNNVEDSLIGSILKNPELLIDVVDVVDVDDFSNLKNRKLWNSFVEQHNSGKVVDIFASAEAIDNLEYVTELSVNAIGANVEAYAKSVALSGLKRRVAMSIDEARRELDSVSTREDIEGLVSGLTAHTENSAPEFVEMREMIKETFERLDYRHKQKGVTGLLTGFEGIDARLGGIEATDLVIVAGRPSMGKTTYAMNIAERIAVAGGNVLVFSMEMSQQQLMDKLLASCSGVDINLIRSGMKAAKSEHWDQINSGAYRLKQLEPNLSIIDRPAMHINHLSAVATKFARRRKLDLIVIDYLQLMRADSNSRFEEISTISRQLKALAVRLGTPVMALSQLSRKVEERSSKRPINSDLRESGQIEQDADIIQFAYREEYYDERTENKGLAEIITSKFRNGETGTNYLEADLAKSRFLDTTRTAVERSNGFKY